MALFVEELGVTGKAVPFLGWDCRRKFFCNFCDHVSHLGELSRPLWSKTYDA